LKGQRERNKYGSISAQTRMHVPTSAIKNLRDLRQEREGKRSPRLYSDEDEVLVVVLTALGADGMMGSRTSSSAMIPKAGRM
jgi:hypothetical protein